MCKLYTPCYTHCSQDGAYSGSVPVGVAFWTKEEAEAYLRDNPNPSNGWGEGSVVIELEIMTKE